MAETSIAVEVFCCYSHADETWLRKLETHLSSLQRQGLISLWHDRFIAQGVDWAKIIDTHLETASVILLLVSADFLASDYCYSVEMKRALVLQCHLYRESGYETAWEAICSTHFRNEPTCSTSHLTS